MSQEYKLLAQIGDNWRACIETNPFTTHNGLLSPYIYLERMVKQDCLGVQRWDIVQQFRVTYVAHEIEILTVRDEWTSEALTVLLRTIEALREKINNGDYNCFETNSVSKEITNEPR